MLLPLGYQWQLCVTRAKLGPALTRASWREDTHTENTFNNILSFFSLDFGPRDLNSFSLHTLAFSPGIH